jgi:hypothetical protein
MKTWPPSYDVVIALSFFVGSMVALGCVVSNGREPAALLWSAFDARSWVEVPATLTRIDLPRADCKNGYELEAVYRYAYGGQNHQGYRVGLFSGADWQTSYHRSLNRRLQAALREGRAVPCWVNPDDPSQAVLDRTMRPIVVAPLLQPMLVFASVLGMFALFSGVQLWKTVREELLCADAPAQPWLWRDDWRRGEAHSKTLDGVLLFGAFAIVFNSCSIPSLLTYLWNEDPDGIERRFSLFCAWLFQVVSVGLSLAAFRCLLWWRWGSATLRLATVPLVAGERVAGIFVAPKTSRGQNGYRMTLECSRWESDFEGSRYPVVIWKAEQHIDPTIADDDPTLVGVPVQFELPDDALQTEGDFIRWQLKVHSEPWRPLGFYAEFDVPVFRVAKPDAD